MSMIDDLRKLIQDLIAPDLKSIQSKLDGNENVSKLRDEALSAKIDSKFELVISKMDANQATVMNALNIDKRVEAIERKTVAAASPAPAGVAADTDTMSSRTR